MQRVNSLLLSKKLIIFDMDGCLIDSERFYMESWSETFKERGLDISIERIQTWTGLGWNLIREDIYQIVGNYELVDELRAEREKRFFEHLYKGNVKLKPGALEVLIALNNEGKTLALATSTFSNKAFKLINHFELQQYFDYITCGDEVDETKPSPDIFIKTLEKSSTNSKESIIFEDSQNGVLAAYRANIDCIYIPDVVEYEFPKDYYVAKIKSFEDLLS